MCDRVALIQEGKILSVNIPANIIEEFGRKLLAVRSDKMHSLLGELKQLHGVEDAYPFGEFHHVVGFRQYSL